MMKRQDLEFRAHLEKVDREFLAVVQNHPPLSLPMPRPPFEALIRIVTGQQLSVKAAESVFQKLVVQLNGEVTVNSMLQQDWRSIQSCGLSRSKLNCIQELVEFAGANELELNRWLAKDWNDLRTRLLEIKGIGPWSADMFGLFGLGLEDVFSEGDLGLRLAMIGHLNMPPKAKPAAFAERALLWSPYRSLACLHLWHANDQKP